MNVSRISAYFNILKIRQRAFRRNAALIGTLFFLSILLTWVTGMLGLLAGSEVFLMGLMVIGLGAGFVATWVRWITISNTIELLENLK